MSGYFTRLPMTKFDLTTTSGRLGALFDMTWRDHAFLRVWWTNAHWISDELVRTNQPWPFQIRRWAKRGIKTIVNLRGGFTASFHHLEKQACEQNGIAFENLTVTSRSAPTKEQIREAKALFDRIQYPALIHCKSGADRAGLVSVLYMHFRKGEPIDTARRMLSLRYGHVRQGKTGVLDHVFDTYVEHAKTSGLTFMEWVETVYDPVAVKADFHANWWGTVLVDKILRRE